MSASVAARVAPLVLVGITVAGCPASDPSPVRTVTREITSNEGRALARGRHPQLVIGRTGATDAGASLAVQDLMVVFGSRGTALPDFGGIETIVIHSDAPSSWISLPLLLEADESQFLANAVGPVRQVYLGWVFVEWSPPYEGQAPSVRGQHHSLAEARLVIEHSGGRSGDQFRPDCLGPSDGLTDACVTLHAKMYHPFPRAEPEITLRGKIREAIFECANVAPEVFVQINQPDCDRFFTASDLRLAAQFVEGLGYSTPVLVDSFPPFKVDFGPRAIGPDGRVRSFFTLQSVMNPGTGVIQRVQLYYDVRAPGLLEFPLFEDLPGALDPRDVPYDSLTGESFLTLFELRDVLSLLEYHRLRRSHTVGDPRPLTSETEPVLYWQWHVKYSTYPGSPWLELDGPVRSVPLRAMLRELQIPQAPLWPQLRKLFIRSRLN